jgi:hypothetical protein
MTLPHGIWAPGTSALGAWHMGTWGSWANKKTGNAHHVIGEISCSMCLIVASERNVVLSAWINFVRVTFHLPSALKPWS